MSKKTALVAGGAGFVGSHLCDLLLNKGYHLVVVDNCITGRKENIAHIQSQIEFIDTDIRVPYSQWLSSLRQLEIDEIYNLASPASPVDFAKMPNFILTTGSEGHKNLLELARQNKSKGRHTRVFYASTSEIYGEPLVHPQSESYFGNVNPIGERSCYDEAKRFGEALSMAYHREYELDTRIVRIFNTYGPRMRATDGRVICNFFAQGLQGAPLTIYGDGQQTRSFCYVSDLVRGFYMLMQSDVFTPINLGNPVEKTILEMAETIKKLTGNNLEVKFLPALPDDPKRRKPDISQAIRLLGWQPEVSLEEGLEETLEFFRSNY